MQWVFGLILVILIVILALFSLIRNKKQGKTSCGCGCSNCAMKGSCHSVSENSAHNPDTSQPNKK